MQNAHIEYQNGLGVFEGVIHELLIVDSQIISKGQIVFGDLFPFVVQSLSLTHINLGVIDKKTFHKYHSCQKLSISNAKFQNDDGHFLSEFGDNLTKLWMQYVPGNLNMNMLFGYRKYWNISDLTLRANGSGFRVIAARNFSCFPHLLYLDLSSSAIEIILEGSFDFVSNTLIVLRLANNKLKSVGGVLFPFVEKSSQATVLELRLNHIICDCAFYQLRNIIEWNMNSVSLKDPYIRMTCTVNISNVAETYTDCREIQKIKTAKMCSIGDGRSFYAYTKFKIRINALENRAVIKGPTESRYRLLAFNLVNNSKFTAQCEKEESRITTKCLLLRNATAFIALTDIALPPVTTFCINYVSGGTKRFWPLHCVTYSALIKTEIVQFPLFLITFAFLSLVALLFGLAISKIITCTLLAKPRYEHSTDFYIFIIMFVNIESACGAPF